MCITNGNVNVGGASYYTKDSWENYQHAKTFALKVAAEATGTAENPTELRPSKVNAAMSNLITSWKRLVKGCDYTALDNAISNSQNIIGQAATPEENNTYKVFTKDSYDAFYAAYTAAKNIDRNLADTVENNKKIAETAQNLETAIANIVKADQGGGEEPAWAVNTNTEFYTANGFVGYKPWLETTDDGGLLDATFGLHLEEYSHDVDGLIFGVPEYGGYTAEELIDPDSLQNATVELVAGDNGEGTGSLVIIRNAETEEIVCIYMVVFRGDINGDCAIDDSDQISIAYFESGEEDWQYEDSYKHMFFGGDTNYDFAVDSTDYVAYGEYAGGTADFSQTNVGDLIYQE